MNNQQEEKKRKIDYDIVRRIDSTYERMNSLQNKIESNFKKFNKEKKQIALDNYTTLMNLFFEDVSFEQISIFVVERIYPSLKDLLNVFELGGLNEEIEVCVWSDKPRYTFTRQFVYSQIFKTIRFYKRKVKTELKKEKIFAEKINKSIENFKGD